MGATGRLTMRAVGYYVLRDLIHDRGRSAFTILNLRVSE